MGTKTILFFVCSLLTYITNKFDLWLLNMMDLLNIESYYVSPEFVLCLTMGTCMGFNLWLLWKEQIYIKVVIETVLSSFKRSITDN